MTGAPRIRVASQNRVARFLVVFAILGACRNGPAEPKHPTAARPRAPAGSVAATVTRVVDGDTVHVDLHGRDVAVRLIGVDSPESVAPGEPAACGGRAASHFTSGRLSGREVRLEFDVKRIDLYGRTLAYVWIHAELFNETLVRRGDAVAATYPPDVRYAERLLAAEASARSRRVGLWGRCGASDRAL